MTREWVRLGAAIKAAYTAMGLSQKAFGETAKVSRSTLTRLVAGAAPEPSAATLVLVERALGWPEGTCLAIAEGADAPEPGQVREITVRKPAALMEDQDLIDRLPEDIRAELREGEVLGVDVVDLGPSEAGTRMVVIVKRSEDAPADAVREALEEWRRRRRDLRKH